MENRSYSTTILVDQSPEKVFDAINNVRGWWQGEITGSTDKLNEEFVYEVPGIHLSKQKIVELIPNSKVVWQITESKISFVSDKEEWLDSTIIFDITTDGKKTKLNFTHHGLIPAIECYSDCSGAWDSLIKKSLFSLITTGKGVKVF